MVLYYIYFAVLQEENKYIIKSPHTVQSIPQHIAIYYTAAGP